MSENKRAPSLCCLGKRGCGVRPGGAERASRLPSLTTPPHPPTHCAGLFLQQLSQACEGLLPSAARAALLAEAGRRPFYAERSSDSAAKMRAAMERNPVEAEARAATDL